MSKKRTKLHIRIPPYEYPRNEWRKKLHAVFAETAQRRQVTYDELEQLELEIKLYIRETSIAAHDVDNRLKDVMDALQGRAGGPKVRRLLIPIIPNDRQIVRVTIEKLVPPWQSKGFGHVVIRRYRKD